MKLSTEKLFDRCVEVTEFESSQSLSDTSNRLYQTFFTTNRSKSDNLCKSVNNMTDLIFPSLSNFTKVLVACSLMLACLFVSADADALHKQAAPPDTITAVSESDYYQIRDAEEAEKNPS
jgi:hypothetical protein